jgi:hypothetical protein
MDPGITVLAAHTLGVPLDQFLLLTFRGVSRGRSCVMRTCDGELHDADDRDALALLARDAEYVRVA